MEFGRTTYENDFYDTVESQANPLHFKKKKGAAHRTGVDLETIVPSLGEVRLLGNRIRQCTYYQVGK